MFYTKPAKSVLVGIEDYTDITKPVSKTNPVTYSGRDFIVEYEDISQCIRGLSYTPSLRKNNGKFTFALGCLTVNESDIEIARKKLNGEPLPQIKSIKKRGGSALKSPIVDQSEKYFIMATGKAYPKTDYVETMVNTNSFTVVMRNDYVTSVGARETRIPVNAMKKVVAYLQYILSVVKKLESEQQ